MEDQHKRQKAKKKKAPVKPGAARKAAPAKRKPPVRAAKKAAPKKAAVRTEAVAKPKPKLKAGPARSSSAKTPVRQMSENAALAARPQVGKKPSVKKAPVSRKKKIEAKVASKAVAKGPLVSPLAPKSYPSLPPVGGVVLGTAAAGIKYAGRDDVMIARMASGTQAAGVFTTSKTASAPVEWCRANLVELGEGRMLVVNSGNSNAFTGKLGTQTVRTVGAAAAKAAGCRHKDVFMASTGVIGVPLDPAPVVAGLQSALDGAADTSAHWMAAARAIMTTDTFPKLATRTAKIGGREVTINGIGKGSGMIAPDLATMLVFIFTDAAIAASALQPVLQQGARDSFNSITVDSDTSTSDTVLLFATGAAMEGEAPVTRLADPRLKDFREKLNDLMMDLAHQVVRDGEGATKFVKVEVAGAQSYQAAKRIGMAIANSPLVKTAIAGEDANWGRIVMAVGKSGEAADRDKLAIRIGGVDVARNGMAVTGYDETPVVVHMKGQNIEIEVDVGVGNSTATVWTCDLTYEYIRINADYRS